MKYNYHGNKDTYLNAGSLQKKCLNLKKQYYIFKKGLLLQSFMIITLVKFNTKFCEQCFRPNDCCGHNNIVVSILAYYIQPHSYLIFFVLELFNTS